MFSIFRIIFETILYLLIVGFGTISYTYLHFYIFHFCAFIFSYFYIFVFLYFYIFICLYFYIFCFLIELSSNRRKREMSKIANFEAALQKKIQIISNFITRALLCKFFMLSIIYSFFSKEFNKIALFCGQ